MCDQLPPHLFHKMIIFLRHELTIQVVYLKLFLTSEYLLGREKMEYEELFLPL